MPVQLKIKKFFCSDLQVDNFLKMFIFYKYSIPVGNLICAHAYLLPCKIYHKWGCILYYYISDVAMVHVTELCLIRTVNVGRLIFIFINSASELYRVPCCGNYGILINIKFYLDTVTLEQLITLTPGLAFAGKRFRLRNI